MGKNDAFIIMGFNEDLTKIVVLHREKKDKSLGESIAEKSIFAKKTILLIKRNL